ncbi:MAG: PEP-CTERM sorting domain-containing protein [Gemmatimonadaceae bacterium]
MNRPLLAVLTASLLTAGASVQAQTLLTTPFGGTQATNILGICPTGYCQSAPYAIGTNGFGVSFNGDAPYLVGIGGAWGLVGNGNWTGAFGYAGTNDQLGDNLSNIFSFSAPVTSVGAFMNYAPGQGGAPTLIAYNLLNVMVASYDLSALAPINTPAGSDQGAFRGISYAGGISKLELKGGFLVNRDLFATRDSVVPEPATMTLLALGLAGMAVARRKKRSQ